MVKCMVAGISLSRLKLAMEYDNIWDLPYTNKTIVENILDEVTVELETTPIETGKRGKMGDVLQSKAVA